MSKRTETAKLWNVYVLVGQNVYEAEVVGRTQEEAEREGLRMVNLRTGTVGRVNTARLKSPGEEERSEFTDAIDADAQKMAQLRAENKRLREALGEIANADFRGNRSSEANIAYRALHPEEER